MNAHTKQQQDKVFETDFIDSQKLEPPFVRLWALSHIQEHCIRKLGKIQSELKLLFGVNY